MARLIDADALKDTLLKYNYTTAHNQIFRYIDEQPTVNDTEEIVKQLETLYESDSENKWSKTVRKVWNRAIEMCVRIVRGGAK